jgi:hypothetical protein
MRNVECLARVSLSRSGKFLFFGGPTLMLTLLVGCNGSGLPVGDVGDGGPGTGGKASGSGGTTSGSGGTTSGSGGATGSGGSSNGSGGGGQTGTGGTGGQGNPGKTCGGIAAIPCPADQYCHFKDGECRTIADVGGVCASKPTVCTADFAPVCGCDNKTYSNSCAAATAGVSVGATSACNAQPDAGTKTDAAPTGKACGGIAGVGCPTGEFCRYPTGQCQIADNQGQCTPKAQACTAVVGQQVCGCDGKTYNDECAAAAAGVSLKSTGVCP